MHDEPFPPMPAFSPELIEECKINKDGMPLIFEWYKYVAIVCIRTASISPRSVAFRKISNVQRAILIGLLNRCARLMLSTVKLAREGRFGETTMLLDRCVAETAVKVQWLCVKDSDECFKRYLAEGLKRDLVLKGQIEKNVSEREGQMWVIEKRMLESIDACVESSGLTAAEILEMKQLQSLSDMHRDLKLDDIFYTITQRMGSHGVHGTWTDLIVHYLEKDESDEFKLRDHNVRPHENEFILISLIIVDTLWRYIEYLSIDAGTTEAFRNFFEDIRSEIAKIRDLVLGDDLEVVDR